MNQQDEYFMIEFNEKINNGKKTTVDEKNKAISLLIWGTVIKTFEPPKKIGENKYQQMFSNGLKVEYSYSKDGKDLIIEYEFESGKKSEEQDKKDKKDNKKTEDIFEIFLFKPKEIIYTKQIYEVGEIFVNDKSWKILEKIHREDKINIKEKKILDGDYNVSIAQNRIDCKGDNCSFEIVKGWNTNNMIIGKTMIPGKTFKERSGYEGELLIEQGDILLDNIISEIKKSSKGKKIKLVVFEEKMKKSDLNIVLFENIDKIDRLAKKYNLKKHIELVLQFIRYHFYNDSNWDIVAGKIDKKFIEYVLRNNSDLLEYFKKKNNIYSKTTKDKIIEVDFEHLIATLNALIYDTGIKDRKIKPKSKIDKKIMDIGKLCLFEYHYNNLSGWAGDLQTLISEDIMNNKKLNSIQDLRKITYNLVGKKGTTFSREDLVADTDAYNIYLLLKNEKFNNKSLKEILEEYYRVGYKKRYRTFTNNFNKETIRMIVYTYVNEYYYFFKWPLLTKVDLTEKQRESITDGFTDYIWEQVKIESEEFCNE